MTLYELYDRVKYAIDMSPLGGDTVVCLSEREREYAEITSVYLDADEDGALFLLHID